MTPPIVDRTAEVAAALPDAKWSVRLPSQIDTVICHRVSVSQMALNLGRAVPRQITIVDLARLSLELPALGRKLAYPLLVLADGTIDRGLPLLYVSPHARSAWNRRAIGVAFDGDFRRAPPTLEQRDTALWLLPRLRAAYCLRSMVEYATPLTRQVLPSLMEHGEAPDSHDGTKAPGRHEHCAGVHFDIAGVRFQCDSMSIWTDHIPWDTVYRAREELDCAGIGYDFNA